VKKEVHIIIQGVPLATEPGTLADRCSVSQQLGALQTHTTDKFLFISHTTNVLLFKFRCNIFAGVRIIIEMPGSVVCGTPYMCLCCPQSCTSVVFHLQNFRLPTLLARLSHDLSFNP